MTWPQGMGRPMKRVSRRDAMYWAVMICLSLTF